MTRSHQIRMPQTDNTAQGDNRAAGADRAIAGVIPTGGELHDALMGPIERDLTTANLPLLDEKYAGETDAQRAGRMERYRTALKKYDIAFSSWIHGLRQKADAYRQEVLSEAEQQSSANDQGAMEQLESKLSSENDT